MFLYCQICYIIYNRKSLQFFRGSAYDITEEINEIKEKHESKLELQGKSKSWIWPFQKIVSPAFFKPFSCIGVTHMLTEMSGFNIMVIYMIKILKDSGSSIDPNLCPIIVGSIRIVFAGTYFYFDLQEIPT